MSRTLCRVFMQLICLVLIACAVPAAAQTYDRTEAVILAYQRVGEDIYPGTNISADQFAEHVQELIEGGYHVAPLKEIVTALQAKAKLPDKTVAITFNGAYRSALDKAIPMLLENNLPFTVFFSPGQAGGTAPQYMSWEDLKRLSRHSQVTLGLHPASYTRLTESSDAEIHRQINNAIASYRKELGRDPQFFAYPFGEYTKQYRNIVSQSGFLAAFGQQSGVAYDGSDIYALPRFSLTDAYSDDDRFRMAATALPLPVSDVAPDSPHIGTDNPPTFGFTVDDSLAGKLSQMSCFFSEQGKPDIQIVGKNRVELRVTEPFEEERVRLNCTMPGPQPKPGEDQRWRWFGMLLTTSQPDDTQELDSETEPAAGPLPN